MTQLNRLIERLCDADIEFVVVGGFAGMLHGSALVTRRLDICAVSSTENLEKLRDALWDLFPTQRQSALRSSFLDDPEPSADAENPRLETALGTLHIFAMIEGVGDYVRVRDASIEIELFGRRCRVISIEDLIRAKESSGGPMDLLAAKELRAILELTTGR